MVCSNKEAQKRLAEALPQFTIHLMANAYTCTQIQEKWSKKHIKKHGTWTKIFFLYSFESTQLARRVQPKRAQMDKNTHPETIIKAFTGYQDD